MRKTTSVALITPTRITKIPTRFMCIIQSLVHRVQYFSVGVLRSRICIALVLRSVKGFYFGRCVTVFLRLCNSIIERPFFFVPTTATTQPHMSK
eukprot:UN01894